MKTSQNFTNENFIQAVVLNGKMRVALYVSTVAQDAFAVAVSKGIRKSTFDVYHLDNVHLAKCKTLTAGRLENYAKKHAIQGI